jgi:hypothetical protein
MLDVMHYSLLKDFVTSHVMTWEPIVEMVGWIDYIENHHWGLVCTNTYIGTKLGMKDMTTS